MKEKNHDELFTKEVRYIIPFLYLVVFLALEIVVCNMYAILLSVN